MNIPISFKPNLTYKNCSSCGWISNVLISLSMIVWNMELHFSTTAGLSWCGKFGISRPSRTCGSFIGGVCGTAMICYNNRSLSAAKSNNCKNYFYLNRWQKIQFNNKLIILFNLRLDKTRSKKQTNKYLLNWSIETPQVNDCVTLIWFWFWFWLGNAITTKLAASVRQWQTKQQNLNF